MSKLSVYDPKQLIVVFGAIPITGWADGDYITISADEDAFTKQIGVDGEACRSKSNNRGGKATLTLGQWSPVNDLMSAWHEADRLSPAGDGIAPFMCKDLSGTTLAAAEKAWIMKEADIKNGKEAGSREWIIDSDSMIIHNGSQTRV